MDRTGSFCIPWLNRRRTSVRQVFLLGLVGALLAAPALAQQISSQLIVSGGGTSRSPGGCRVLEGSMGQPVVGTTSGGAFQIRAGYWAGPGNQARDSVFSSGFEECN